MRVGNTRYVSQSERKACSFLVPVIFGLIALFGLYGLFSVESEWKHRNEAFAEVAPLVRTVAPDYVSRESGPVHFASNSFIPKSDVLDNDFFFSTPKSTLRLRRKTEYCQWIESVHYHKDDNDNEVKTYTYIKSWRDSRVPSIFFDQPFNHHNPQDDPFPTQTQSTSEVKVGAYYVPQSFIEDLNTFKALRTPDHQQIIDSSSSPAAKLGFNYVGDGYFYRAYQASTGQKLAKLFGQFVEGSLFDFQLGDLFSTCEAGDIRVRFELVAPQALSVIGNLVDRNGRIEPILTSSGYQVKLLQEGLYNSDEMFERNLSEYRAGMIVGRVALVLVLFIFSLVSFQGNFLFSFVVALFGSGVILSLFWLTIYGFTLKTSLFAVICFLPIGYGFFVSKPPLERPKDQ